MAGSWDLTKCVVQEAIKRENHCSLDRQEHITLTSTHSISPSEG